MIRPTADGILLSVRVIPRASKSGLGGVRNGALVVRLNAPPVDGAANLELIEVVARTLDVPRRQVTLVSGERSRSKTLRVVGRSVADAERALG